MPRSLRDGTVPAMRLSHDAPTGRFQGEVFMITQRRFSMSLVFAAGVLGSLAACSSADDAAAGAPAGTSSPASSTEASFCDALSGAIRTAAERRARAARRSPPIAAR